MEGDAFRPESFGSFVGQEAIKRQLQVAISAARADNRPMEHVLLTGPPGFGKTSLASIIAQALRDPFESYMMPIKNSVLVGLTRRFCGVVLLDELHRASDKAQEELLPLLESGYIQLPNGSRLHNEWLTIVGATTERENIIGPLYDRFVLKPEFDPYTDEEMATIIKKMIVTAEIPLSDEDALVLGKASGGTPRNARQFVLSARDLFTIEGTVPSAAEILALNRVNEDGLTHQHKLYLETLDKLGGQAGIKPLSMMLRLHASVIMELERLLLENDYITYSARGRELTAAGFAKLNGKGPIRRVI
jgi:Holliday junction DNA helicase RuvB